MPTRTHTYHGTPRFIADEQTVTRGSGVQIDWANVNVSYKESDGLKFLRAGTVVGELLGGGKASPRIITTNPATGVLETDAKEGDMNAALTGYSVIRSGHLYENLMPDSTGGPPKTLPSAFKTELQTNCPMGFHFSTYQDTR